jgi:hypothetical protein
VSSRRAQIAMSGDEVAAFLAEQRVPRARRSAATAGRT